MEESNLLTSVLLNLSAKVLSLLLKTPTPHLQRLNPNEVTQSKEHHIGWIPMLFKKTGMPPMHQIFGILFLTQVFGDYYYLSINRETTPRWSHDCPGHVENAKGSVQCPTSWRYIRGTVLCVTLGCQGFLESVLYERSPWTARSSSIARACLDQECESTYAWENLGSRYAVNRDEYFTNSQARMR